MFTILSVSDREIPKLKSCESWLQVQIESIIEKPYPGHLPVSELCQLKSFIPFLMLFSISVNEKKSLITLNDGKPAYLLFFFSFTISPFIIDVLSVISSSPR